MPRLPRIHAPGAFHHVTLRGNHRQDIFFTSADRVKMNEIVADTLERCRSRLHAYCLMTNHVHFLVQVGDLPLGRVMLRIASRYARTVQRRFHTTGHLFERRYHALLVDADEYLLELLRYIHLNPVRTQMVDRPSDYPWSSHHVYMGTRAEAWVTTDFALRMLHPDRDTAIDSYRRFVDQAIGQHSTSPLTDRNAHDARVLGSDDFLGKLLNQPLRPKSRQSLPDLIESACRQFSVTPEALLSSGKDRHLTKVRIWIAHQALTGRVASLSAVARALCRTEGALRQGLRHHFNYP
jgi:putative transposase